MCVRCGEEACVCAGQVGNYTYVRVRIMKKMRT